MRRTLSPHAERLPPNLLNIELVNRLNSPSSLRRHTVLHHDWQVVRLSATACAEYMPPAAAKRFRGRINPAGRDLGTLDRQKIAD